MRYKSQLENKISDSSELQQTISAINWASENKEYSLKVDGVLNVVDYLKTIKLESEAITFLLKEIESEKGELIELKWTYLYDELGRLYLQKGEFPNSQKWFFKSLKAREESGNDTLLAVSYRRIGIFYGQQKKDSIAIKYFLKQLSLSEKIGSKRWKYSAMTNLGVAYRNIKKPIESIFYLRSSLKILKENKFGERSLATTYHNMAYAFEELNEIDSSIFYYKKAANIRKSVKSTLLASSYNNIGYLYSKIGNRLDSAEKYLLVSKELSENSNDRLLLRRIYSNLSRIYREKSSWKNAYLFLFQYDTLNQSIFNGTKSKQIAELQTKYETEKKEQELALTTAELNLSTAENRTLMTTLFVAVGFTIIVILLNQKRLKEQRALRERDQQLATREVELRQKEQELHQQQIDQMVRDQELKSINAMLEGEEKERKRIAEDLHDRVGSMLSAMKLQADSSNTKMNGLLDETVEEVRRISHNLETKVLNRFGLVAALEDLAEKIKSSGKVVFELQYLDLTERLDNKVEINTYRIVQELVSNALKHSQASEITTQVNRINNQLVITVEDNGVGFDSLEVKEKSSGMGLKNVMSRAHELNGNFNVDSGKGQGTTLTVDFPI